MYISQATVCTVHLLGLYVMKTFHLRIISVAQIECQISFGNISCHIRPSGLDLWTTNTIGHHKMRLIFHVVFIANDQIVFKTILVT